MTDVFHFDRGLQLCSLLYPVRNTLPAVPALEVVHLLAVHPRDDFQIIFSLDVTVIYVR